MFTAYVVQAPGGTANHAIGLVRGPGGSVAVILAAAATLPEAIQLAQAAADGAASALNAGKCRAEWDAAIQEKDEAEVASATLNDLADLQALAGIPTNNALGRYLKARAALRVALGLSP